ncbi:MAG TPA: DUF2795 domain-containing protein [Anaerolineae bacterium]|jgi:hypothetical protein|nr:DUF2795 domain-containing protein [Anaerolineae bacterium]
MVSTAKVSQFLEGIDFPADKKRIVDYAREKNAPQDVLNVLERMPEGTYYSMAGVWDAMSKVA